MRGAQWIKRERPVTSRTNQSSAGWGRGVILRAHIEGWPAIDLGGRLRCGPDRRAGHRSSKPQLEKILAALLAALNDDVRERP